MRSSIFAVALLTAIGLLATIHMGSLSNEAAAQEFAKKKGGKIYGNKKEFYYGLCVERGGTAACERIISPPAALHSGNLS